MSRRGVFSLFVIIALALLVIAATTLQGAK
jgi:hypothetical protein